MPSVAAVGHQRNRGGPSIVHPVLLPEVVVQRGRERDDGAEVVGQSEGITPLKLSATLQRRETGKARRAGKEDGQARAAAALRHGLPEDGPPPTCSAECLRKRNGEEAGSAVRRPRSPLSACYSRREPERRGNVTMLLGSPPPIAVERGEGGSLGSSSRCRKQRRSPSPLDRQARRHKVFRRRKLGATFLPSFPSELVVATDRIVHRRWGCDAGLQTSPSTLVAAAAA